MISCTFDLKLKRMFFITVRRYVSQDNRQNKVYTVYQNEFRVVRFSVLLKNKWCAYIRQNTIVMTFGVWLLVHTVYYKLVLSDNISFKKTLSIQYSYLICLCFYIYLSLRRYVLYIFLYRLLSLYLGPLK